MLGASNRFEQRRDLAFAADIAKGSTITDHWGFACFFPGSQFTANFPLQGKIDADTFVVNKGLHHELADAMKATCRQFIG